MSYWSPDRVTQLHNFWVHGTKSATEIGHEMGITRCAVLGKVFRLKLERLNPTASCALPRAIRQPIKLVEQSKAFATDPVRPYRAKRLRAHEGMQTVPVSEINRLGREPTKSELREMIAQAVRNTAALGVSA